MNPNEFVAFLARVSHAGLEGVVHIEVQHDRGCPCEDGRRSMASCTCDEVNVSFARKDLTLKQFHEIFQKEK